MRRYSIDTMHCPPSGKALVLKILIRGQCIKLSTKDGIEGKNKIFECITTLHKRDRDKVRHLYRMNS